MNTHGPGSSPEYTAAWNAGADARIVGKPLSQCPHTRTSAPSQYLGWRAGWIHANEYWGEDVKRRWVFRRLPAILRARRESA